MSVLYCLCVYNSSSVCYAVFGKIVIFFADAGIRLFPLNKNVASRERKRRKESLDENKDSSTGVASYYAKAQKLANKTLEKLVKAFEG